MSSSVDSSSPMDQLQNSIQSILKDSVQRLKSSQLYESNPSLEILPWDHPVQILKPNLAQLSDLINDSKGKLPASEALLFGLRRLVQKHDLDKQHDSQGSNGRQPGELAIESCRDLFSRLDVVFATRAAGEYRFATMNKKRSKGRRKAREERCFGPPSFFI